MGAGNFAEECPEGMIELKTERGVYRVYPEHRDLLTEIQKPMKKYKANIPKEKRCSCYKPYIRDWKKHPSLSPDYEIAFCSGCEGKLIVPKTKGEGEEK